MKDMYQKAMDTDPESKEYFERFDELLESGLMEKVVVRDRGQDQLLWVATEKGNRIARLLNHLGANK